METTKLEPLDAILQQLDAPLSEFPKKITLADKTMDEIRTWAMQQIRVASIDGSPIVYTEAEKQMTPFQRQIWAEGSEAKERTAEVLSKLGQEYVSYGGVELSDAFAECGLIEKCRTVIMTADGWVSLDIYKAAASLPNVTVTNFDVVDYYEPLDIVA